MLENSSSAYIKQAPSMLVLGACFIYEMLVVAAILFVSAFVFLWLFGDASHGLKRHLFQFYLWVTVGVYFIWCWNKKGQTLAMKTWRLKLLNEQAQLLTPQKAALRYLLATLSLLFFGLGFIWAVADKEHQYWHDRYMKNKLTTIKQS